MVRYRPRCTLTVRMVESITKGSIVILSAIDYRFWSGLRRVDWHRIIDISIKTCTTTIMEGKNTCTVNFQIDSTGKSRKRFIRDPYRVNIHCANGHCMRKKQRTKADTDFKKIEINFYWHIISKRWWVGRVL